MFCIHLISVSGTDPSTSQDKLYSWSAINCLGLNDRDVETGFTVDCVQEINKKTEISPCGSSRAGTIHDEGKTENLVP